MASLVACGGGGDTATPLPAVAPDVADQFVGTWAGCEAYGPLESAYQEVTFTKLSASALAATQKQTVYTTTNCTGALRGSTATNPNPNILNGITATLSGTKLIGTATVVTTDNTFVGDPQVIKQVLLADANRLRVGDNDTGAPVDANGYPNTFAPVTYTKQ